MHLVLLNTVTFYCLLTIRVSCHREYYQYVKIEIYIFAKVECLLYIQFMRYDGVTMGIIYPIELYIQFMRYDGVTMGIL